MAGSGDLHGFCDMGNGGFGFISSTRSQTGKNIELNSGPEYVSIFEAKMHHATAASRMHKELRPGQANWIAFQSPIASNERDDASMHISPCHDESRGNQV